MKETFIFVLFLTTILVTFLAITISDITESNRTDCAILNRAIPNETFEWKFWGGCGYVTEEGIWLELNNPQTFIELFGNE